MPVTGWGGVTLTVEIDLSQAVENIGSSPASYLALWDVAAWDADTWEGGTTWTDVSQWVTGVKTNRSFSQELTAYTAGRLSLTLDNTDGRFSPDNLSSPYRVGSSTAIGILRPVRVTATYGGMSWALFTGRLEEWTEAYAGLEGARVDVSAIDGFADLGAFDGFEQPATGTSDGYGARIERILANAGYLGDRAVDVGVHTFQATTLAQNALTELKLTADSEGGAVWLAANGTFYADGQNALIEKARSNTVQVTFSNLDTDARGIGYELTGFSPAYDGSQVKNIAAYARVGGTQQSYIADASRALYGDRQASRTDLVCETDEQVQLLARRYVGLYSDPERRIEGVSFSPMLQPTAAKVAEAWSALATDRIQLRALVLLNHMTHAGFTITKHLFVRGISHSITPKGWDVDVTFTSATIWHALVDSRWDVGAWDTAAWSW